MTTKASSHVMINGLPVVVVSRNKMTSPIVHGYRDCIEEFVIRGSCDEWAIGTEVEVSSVDEYFRGKIHKVFSAGPHKVTIRVSYREALP
jgi:hypothetical protein